MNLMGYLTLVLGTFLILVGVHGFFFSSAGFHPTALIPAGFGVVFLLLGLLSQKPKWRKHVMHGSALLSLVGLLLTGGGALSGLGQYFSGSEVVQPAAAFSKFMMATACLIYLVICVQSFVEARKDQRAQEEREAHEKLTRPQSRSRRR